MTVTIQNENPISIANWLQKNQNEAAGQSSVRQFLEYTNETTGFFRCAQILKGVLKIRNEMGYPESSVTKELDNAAGGTMALLSLGRLPAATEGAYKAVSHFTQDNGMTTGRKIGLLFKDAGDAISAWANATMFFTGNLALKEVSRVSSLSSETADLTLSAVDYRQASTLEASATGEVKKVFTHTKNYYWLRIAKAVVSVTLALLAAAFVYMGITLLSALAISALSLAAVFLAIRRDLYKEEGEYKVISFNRSIQIVSI